MDWRRAGRRLVLVAGLAVLAGCTALGLDAAEPGTGAEGRPRYELVIEGGRLSRRAVLQLIERELEDFERRGMRKSAVDDAAWTLEGALRRRGHPFAQVGYAFDPGTEQRLPVITLRIDEGPYAVLEGVELPGLTVFPRAELVDLFDGPLSWATLTGLPPYVEESIEGAVAAISSMYWGEGYLLARVGPAETVFSDDRRSASVVVPIVEGPCFRLAQVELLGTGAEGLAPLVQDFLGQPYFPQVAFAVRARLLEELGNRGHADARIEIDERRDDATGEVVLALEVTPGPRVTIGQIQVEGLQRTHPPVVLERLTLQPGDTWSTERQRQSLTRLYRSGLFQELSIELEPGEGAERDLLVDVQERVPREVFVEPGYGSYERLRLTAGYRNRNVFGQGWTLHTVGSVSSKARRVVVGLTDPWFLDSDLVGDVSVFASEREEPSFTRNERGVASTVTDVLSPRWTIVYGYSFRRSTVDDVEVVTPEVEEALASVNIGALSVEPSFDSRDEPFSPTRGVHLRTSLEFGNGLTASELDFARARLGWSWFESVGRASVVGLSLRLGAIAPLPGTDVIPLQERFFNGGENTVRSFKEDDLGPKDVNGEPIGGEAYSVLSVELRRPLGGRLEGALFYDVGTVAVDYNDLFDFEDPGQAFGFGLRYQLPVGPVRLDVGLNPDPEEDQDDWVAHFSVGMPF